MVALTGDGGAHEVASARAQVRHRAVDTQDDAGLGPQTDEARRALRRRGCASASIVRSARSPGPALLPGAPLARARVPALPRSTIEVAPTAQGGARSRDVVVGVARGDRPRVRRGSRPPRRAAVAQLARLGRDEAEPTAERRARGTRRATRRGRTRRACAAADRSISVVDRAATS